MAMSEILSFVLSGIAGIALGLIYFGGLWVTIRHGLSSRYSAWWFAISMVVRMVLVVAGFFVVMGHHWERLAMCLVGFVVGRLVVTWMTRTPLPLEVDHAPHP